jgi:hypothetical protein
MKKPNGNTILMWQNIELLSNFYSSVCKTKLLKTKMPDIQLNVGFYDVFASNVRLYILNGEKLLLGHIP